MSYKVTVVDGIYNLLYRAYGLYIVYCSKFEVMWTSAVFLQKSLFSDHDNQPFQLVGPVIIVKPSLTFENLSVIPGIIA